MEVKVVTGCNYGDESKGLVSGCLAREAYKDGKKILNVFYNGCAQRAHSFKNVIYRTIGAGSAYGADTFYHKMYVVDPIMLWLYNTPTIIDPNCRVIFPCDVLYGQTREKQVQHGSCGYGLFSAVKRCEKYDFRIADLFLPADTFYKEIQEIDGFYSYSPNELHNLSNFLRAVKWLKENCKVIGFTDLIQQEHYETIIFEGGQGLLLDQANIGDFPHLTPSSVGAYNIHTDIEKLGVPVDLFYVSRSYMTRHGYGPMDMECAKEDINSSIIDNTNKPNEWQGSLRFGYIDVDKLYKRVEDDSIQYKCDKTINMVYTHLNYTKGNIATIKDNEEIVKPKFVNNIWGSDTKDYMEKINCFKL